MVRRRRDWKDHPWPTLAKRFEPLTRNGKTDWARVQAVHELTAKEITRFQNRKKDFNKAQKKKIRKGPRVPRRPTQPYDTRVDELDAWMVFNCSDGIHTTGSCRMGSPDDPPRAQAIASTRHRFAPWMASGVSSS